MRTLLKGFIAGAVVLMTGGCAFRSPTVIDDARIKLTADWSAGADGVPSETVKASRDLSAPAQNRFEAKGFITVPVIAPERISVGLQIPEGAFVEDPRFVRGSISVGGLQSAVLASLTGFERREGLLRIEVQIGGLRTVMPVEFSARGKLELEFFGSTTRQVTVSFGLRTPPSEVIRTAGTAKSAREQSKPGQPSFLNPKVYGRQFNLVEVFDFTNTEEVPVELQMPRRVDGRFYQNVIRLSWRDLGCRGHEAGAGVEQLRLPEVVMDSQGLFMFPVDESLNLEAEKSYWNPEGREWIPRTVAPGQSLRIGVYAVGKDADAWSERGPILTGVTQSVVPGACRSICVEFQRPCGPKADYCMQSCVEWHTWREKAVVESGVIGEAAYVDFSAAPLRLRYRFGDFGPNQDGEVREVEIANGRHEAVWN